MSEIEFDVLQIRKNLIRVYNFTNRFTLAHWILDFIIVRRRMADDIKKVSIATRKESC